MQEKPKAEKKRQRIIDAAIATQVIFCMLCLLSVENSWWCIRGGKQRRQLQDLRYDCAAADNLVNYAAIMTTSTAVHHTDFPIDKLTASDEWKLFEDKLHGYAERIKLMEAQDLEVRRRMENRGIWLALASLVVISISVPLQMRRKLAVAEAA